jgi:hypothetical protein
MSEHMAKQKLDTTMTQTDMCAKCSKYGAYPLDYTAVCQGTKFKSYETNFYSNSLASCSSSATLWGRDGIIVGRYITRLRRNKSECLT